MKGLLHENQRGFRQNRSTLHNFKDLSDLIKVAKVQAREERLRKNNTNLRAKSLLVFFDLKKAFDVVDKQRLIEKMKNT